MKPARHVRKVAGFSPLKQGWLKNYREAEDLCLSSQHPGYQGVNPPLRMGLGLSPQTACPPPHSYAEATGAKWALTLGEGEFFSPTLIILVTSQGFHGDKTKEPGGLGELAQTNPLPRIFFQTWAWGRDSRESMSWQKKEGGDWSMKTEPAKEICVLSFLCPLLVPLEKLDFWRAWC